MCLLKLINYFLFSASKIAIDSFLSGKFQVILHLTAFPNGEGRFTTHMNHLTRYLRASSLWETEGVRRIQEQPHCSWGHLSGAEPRGLAAGQAGRERKGCFLCLCFPELFNKKSREKVLTVNVWLTF